MAPKREIHPRSKYHHAYFKGVDVDNPNYGLRQGYVIMLIFYFLVVILSLALWISSMIGTQWKVYHLNDALFSPTGLKISEYPRFRGLWLSCLRNPSGAKELTFLNNFKNSLQFDSCLNLWQVRGQTEASKNVLNFRLATQSLGIIGGIIDVLLLFIELCFFIHWCRRKNLCPKVYQHFMFWMTLITFINFMVKTVLMILFHEMFSYEKSVSTTATNVDLFVLWSGKSVQATSESYGVMYYVAWMSIILLGIALMILICSGSDCLAWFSCSLCRWCQCCFCRWCCDCFFLCCRDCGVFHDHVVECRAHNHPSNQIFYTGDYSHERSVYHNHGYENIDQPILVQEQPSVRKTTIVREYDNRGFNNEF